MQFYSCLKNHYRDGSFGCELQPSRLEDVTKMVAKNNTSHEQITAFSLDTDSKDARMNEKDPSLPENRILLCPKVKS